VNSAVESELILLCNEKLDFIIKLASLLQFVWLTKNRQDHLFLFLKITFFLIFFISVQVQLLTHWFSKQFLNNYALTKESLPKGKAQYNWPPWFDELLLILQTLWFFYRTSYLNEEVNRTKPSRPVRIPCCKNISPTYLKVLYAEAIFNFISNLWEPWIKKNVVKKTRIKTNMQNLRLQMTLLYLKLDNLKYNVLRDQYHKTFYGRILWMFVISLSVCPFKAFPAKRNVSG